MYSLCIIVAICVLSAVTVWLIYINGDNAEQHLEHYSEFRNLSAYIEVLLWPVMPLLDFISKIVRKCGPTVFATAILVCGVISRIVCYIVFYYVLALIQKLTNIYVQ